MDSCSKAVNYLNMWLYPVLLYCREADKGFLCNTQISESAIGKNKMTSPNTVLMHRKPFSQFLPQSFLIKIHKKFLSQCLHTPVNMSNKGIMTRDSLFTCSSLKNEHTHIQRLKRIYTA